MFVARPVAISLFTIIAVDCLLEGHVAGAHYRRPDEMTPHHRRSLRGIDGGSAAPENVAPNEMDALLAETASFWGRNLYGSGSIGKGKGGRGKGSGGKVRLVPIECLRCTLFPTSTCTCLLTFM